MRGTDVCTSCSRNNCRHIYTRYAIACVCRLVPLVTASLTVVHALADILSGGTRRYAKPCGLTGATNGTIVMGFARRLSWRDDRACVALVCPRVPPDGRRYRIHPGNRRGWCCRQNRRWPDRRRRIEGLRGNTSRCSHQAYCDEHATKHLSILALPHLETPYAQSGDRPILPPVRLHQIFRSFAVVPPAIARAPLLIRKESTMCRGLLWPPCTFPRFRNARPLGRLGLSAHYSSGASTIGS